MSDKRPPTIGITCSELPAQRKGSPPRFGLNGAYVHALARAGAAPLLIPAVTDPNLLRCLYALLDGLLLSGGRDIDPVYFGEPLHEKCDLDSPERDEMELALTRWAVSDGKPLLAICRGIQVLNVALGGSLYQDIGDQVPGAGRHTWQPGHPRHRPSHTVTVAADTRLATIVDSTPLPVNSGHHQAVKEVASGLAVAARAPDGIVEALEVVGHPFAIGVQWHPEDLAGRDVRAQRLFDALAEACRGENARRKSR